MVISSRTRRVGSNSSDGRFEPRGVVTHAADELGISRQALYRRMARLEIELERRPRADLRER